ARLYMSAENVNAWWGWKDSNRQPVHYEATRGSAFGGPNIVGSDFRHTPPIQYKPLADPYENSPSEVLCFRVRPCSYINMNESHHQIRLRRGSNSDCLWLMPTKERLARSRWRRTKPDAEC